MVLNEETSNFPLKNSIRFPDWKTKSIIIIFLFPIQMDYAKQTDYPQANPSGESPYPTNDQPPILPPVQQGQYSAPMAQPMAQNFSVGQPSIVGISDCLIS